MEQNDQSIEEILRKQSLLRITSYTHPEISLKHEPINAKQCEQLKLQLRDLVKPKIEKVRQQEYTLQNNKYETVYAEFVQMTISNEAQEKNICNNIRQMHQIADVLMNPPTFGKDLFLSSKQPPSPQQKAQLQNIYKYYQRLYKSGVKKQQNEAEEAIKRAKKFILQQ